MTTTRRRDSLHTVADALGREAVEQGPGHRIYVDARATELGCAARTVRDAVRMLMGKGVLARGGQTVTVAPRQCWSLLDPDVLTWQTAGPEAVGQAHGLAAVARALDADAARHAARQPRPSARALSLVLDMWADGPVAKAADADRAFHRALHRAGSDTRIVSYLGSLISAHAIPGPYCHRPLEAHGTVCQAIADGDASAASDAAARLHAP